MHTFCLNPHVCVTAAGRAVTFDTGGGAGLSVLGCSVFEIMPSDIVERRRKMYSWISGSTWSWTYILYSHTETASVKRKHFPPDLPVLMLAFNLNRSSSPCLHALSCCCSVIGWLDFVCTSLPAFLYQASPNIETMGARSVIQSYDSAAPLRQF